MVGPSWPVVSGDAWSEDRGTGSAAGAVTAEAEAGQAAGRRRPPERPQLARLGASGIPFMKIETAEHGPVSVSRVLQILDVVLQIPDDARHIFILFLVDLVEPSFDVTALIGEQQIEIAAGNVLEARITPQCIDDVIDDISRAPTVVVASEGAGSPPDRSGEQEHDRHRVEHDQQTKREQLHGMLDVCAGSPGELGEVAQRSDVGGDPPALPLDCGHLDLHRTKRLGLALPGRPQFASELALLPGQRHGAVGAAAPRGLLDGRVDLGDSPVEVCHHVRLHGEACVDLGRVAGHDQIPSHGVIEVRTGQEAEDADCVDDHEPGHPGDQDRPERPRRRAPVMAEPRDAHELPRFQDGPHDDDRPEGAREDGRQAIDRECGGDAAERNGDHHGEATDRATRPSVTVMPPQARWPPRAAAGRRSMWPWPGWPAGGQAGQAGWPGGRPGMAGLIRPAAAHAASRRRTRVRGHDQRRDSSEALS